MCVCQNNQPPSADENPCLLFKQAAVKETNRSHNAQCTQRIGRLQYGAKYTTNKRYKWLALERHGLPAADTSLYRHGGLSNTNIWTICVLSLYFFSLALFLFLIYWPFDMNLYFYFHSL